MSVLRRRRNEEAGRKSRGEERPDRAVTEDVHHSGEAPAPVRREAPLLDRGLALERSVAVGLYEEVEEALRLELPGPEYRGVLAGRSGTPPLEMRPRIAALSQLEALIPGFSPVFTSDNFLVHLAAAEAGVGAMVLFRMPPGVGRGRALVPLPIDLGPWTKATVHLVATRSALDIPRVRVVTELLVEELRRLVTAAPSRV